MFVDQIEAAIAVASPSALAELNRVIWKGMTEGALTEDDAGRLSEAIHARQTIAKAAGKPVGARPGRPSIFSPRKPQKAPVRADAIERRRRLAASGPLPPALAAKFTTSEASVMRIVGDECRDRGRCDLALDAIAARAGVSRTTAQNAIRLARRLGLVHVEERPQTGAKNLTNVVTVVDREWRQWLARGPKGIGFRKFAPSETQVLSKGRMAEPSSSPRAPGVRFERGRQRWSATQKAPR